MTKFKLVCLAFDGDMVVERPTFDSIEEASDYSDDMGSKWIFYPFHFVVTDSLKTVKEGDQRLYFLKEKRLSTVRRIFKKVYDETGSEELQYDDAIRLIRHFYITKGLQQ